MNNSIKAINSVAEFHETFLIGNESQPTISEPKTYELRHRLMEEENNEYLEACRKGDIVEIADALGDQLYILAGTILKHGLQDKIQEVFDEIHRSNMSKLDENGQPIFREDGKILKSNLYFKPNIKEILEAKTPMQKYIDDCPIKPDTILVAKNECKFEGVAQLIPGKEYPIDEIVYLDGSITVQTEDKLLWFDIKGNSNNWNKFFEIKNVE